MRGWSFRWEEGWQWRGHPTGHGSRRLEVLLNWGDIHVGRHLLKIAFVIRRCTPGPMLLYIVKIERQPSSYIFLVWCTLHQTTLLCVLDMFRLEPLQHRACETETTYVFELLEIHNAIFTCIHIDKEACSIFISNANTITVVHQTTQLWQSHDPFPTLFILQTLSCIAQPGGVVRHAYQNGKLLKLKLDINDIEPLKGPTDIQNI